VAGAGVTAPQPRHRWRPLGRGPLTRIDWHLELGGNRQLDPYLAWADHTGFAGAGGLPAPGERLTVLIELAPEFAPEWPADTRRSLRLPPAADPARAGAKAGTNAPDNDCPPAPSPSPGIDPELALLASQIDIPGLNLDPSRSSDTERTLRSRFLTARVSLACLGDVIRNGAVRRLQLNLARLPHDPRPTPPEPAGIRVDRLPRTVLGFVDDGCSFAHPSLCDPTGRPRVHFLWDQDERRLQDCDSWLEAVGCGYGAELRHPDLERITQQAWRERRPEQAYERLNYGPVRPERWRHGSAFRDDSGPVLPAGTMRASSHGAGVMHLAAGLQHHGGGRQAPLPLQGWGLPRDAGARAAPLADDLAASQWPLVFVQLPTRTVLDSSGGSLSAHVLDAVRYIIDRAECLPYEPDLDLPDAGSRNPAKTGDDGRLLGGYDKNAVVVTISYGATAGPHDGTSPIEDALMDALRRPNTHIVLAAGNAHRARAHARLELQPGAYGTFAWTVGPDNPHPSFLEIWLPDEDLDDNGRPGRPLYPSEQGAFLIQVRAPGAPVSDALAPGAGRLLERLPQREGDPTEVLGAVVYARRVVQGRLGTMCLIAAMPTRRTTAQDVGPPTPVPPGEWLVEVSRQGSTIQSVPGTRAGAALVCAWAERNDLLYGNLRPQQSRVVSSDAVPEPTEFMPEAIVRMRWAEKGLPLADTPDELQPRPTMGSLSGKAVNFEPDSKQESGLWVVGAYRLADGEMAEYSSGGSSRDGRFERPMRVDNLTETPRLRPDVDAPSDLGAATRGLRVTGMREGSGARLSGTSAAAPSAARSLATLLTALRQLGTVALPPFYLPIPADLLFRPLVIGPVPGAAAAAATPARPRAAPGAAGVAGNVAAAGLGTTPQAGRDGTAARPTPTPRKDDLHRRGRFRIDP
jgi:hypothetical protein